MKLPESTGATKLVSLNTLYSEIRWETLEQRRKNHRLTLFYKMRYSLTPQYLSSLVPESISNVSNYNLRHSNNLRGINARTTQYQQSFLPTAIKEWNNLPLELQQSNSVNSFKYNLTKDKEQTPKYYYTGSRRLQILHTRLRTHCSALNLDLFRQYRGFAALFFPLLTLPNSTHSFNECYFYSSDTYFKSAAIRQLKPLC